jgi:CheY-like chemotaxis protein
MDGRIFSTPNAVSGVHSASGFILRQRAKPNMKSSTSNSNKEGSANVRRMSAQSVAPFFPAESGGAIVRRHILVADRDAGVRDLLANLLRRAGYRVTCAPNGEEAWVTLCADKSDVLITDHPMPALTGLELIRRVRSGPLSALPCILTSAKMPWKENDLLELLYPGMVLAKPFSFIELLTCVRSLLPLSTRRGMKAGANSDPDHNLPPQPDIAWQDDARTRLPLRSLVRAK